MNFSQFLFWDDGLRFRRTFSFQPFSDIFLVMYKTKNIHDVVLRIIVHC